MLKVYALLNFGSCRKNGISVSKYTVNKANLPHTFVPGNVAFGSGSLDLKVSAYDGSGSVQSSEIVTRNTFKFASVRTVIKSSTTPGVVEGNFCYCKPVLTLLEFRIHH